MAITYTSVIANAIAHFNDIQTELHTLGAKRADGSTAITATSDTLVPTDEFDTIIKDQLQLKAIGTYTLTKDDGTEDVSAYQYVVPRAASEFTLTITHKNDTEISIGSISNGYYLLSTSLTGKLAASTSGWFTEGSATSTPVIVGKLKQGSLSDLSGIEDIDGNFVITSQWNTGYLPSTSKTYTMANATFSNATSSNAIFTVIENSTESNISDTASVSLDRALSGYYYAIDMSSTGSATVRSNDAGYVSAAKDVGTGTVAGSNTAYVTIDPAAGSVEVNNPSINPGLISVVDISSTIDPSGSDGVSASLGDIYKSLSAATTTLPPSGYYLAVKSSKVTANSVISANASIDIAGYIPTSYEFSPAVGTVTINASGNYYIPIASATLKNEATEETSYITNSEVTLKDGYLYIDAGYIPNTKVSLSSLIPDIPNDATASHILSGYSAYSDAGELINGSITTWSVPKTFYTSDISIGVLESVVTSESYTGESAQYIKKGSVTMPENISESDADVNVSGGTVTLTKTISTTPNVDIAGWVSFGTPGDSSITLSGSIPTTSLTQSTEKSCTIKNNSISPIANAEKAVISDSVISPFETYVVVEAKSTGAASVGTGYVNENSINFESSDTARIAAAINPTVTNGIPSASLNLTDASTFDPITGDVTSQYSSSKVVNISAVTVLDGSTEYKDKYIVGSFTAKTNPGEATVTVGADVTGTDVDHYTEQLYKRLLGLDYEVLEGDPTE